MADKLKEATSKANVEGLAKDIAKAGKGGDISKMTEAMGKAMKDQTAKMAEKMGVPKDQIDKMTGQMDKAMGEVMDKLKKGEILIQEVMR